jgi:hypothetical protein
VYKNIDYCEGLFGTVLNVFDKTINIETINDKLFVVSLGQVVSPLTVNVIQSANSPTCFSSFTDLVRNGDHVFIAPKTSLEDGKIADILLGSKCIILINKPVQLFENHILKPDLENLQKFFEHKEHLLSMLRESSVDRTGSLLNPDITTKGLLSDFMIQNNGIDIRNPGFADSLSRSLLGFCGRGPGFTPAGDDFISGILTVLNWIRLGLELGSSLIPGPAYRKLTTWTSFKLMESNARGLVDIEVQGLINSIATGDVLHYADSIRRIAKRGHTSGIDFATGATIAVYLAINGITRR